MTFLAQSTHLGTSFTGGFNAVIMERGREGKRPGSGGQAEEERDEVLVVCPFTEGVEAGY